MSVIVKAKELLDALDYWKSDAAKWPCCFPVSKIEELRKAFEDDKESGNLLKIYQDVQTLKDTHSFHVDVLKAQIKELTDALYKRRAMEPKHSHPDHECPECELLSKHRQTT